MSSIDIIHKVMSSLEVVVEDELNKYEDRIEKIEKEHMEEREKLEDRIEELEKQTHIVHTFMNRYITSAVEYEEEYYVFDSNKKLWVLDPIHWQEEELLKNLAQPEM